MGAAYERSSHCWTEELVTLYPVLVRAQSSYRVLSHVTRVHGELRALAEYRPRHHKHPTLPQHIHTIPDTRRLHSLMEGKLSNTA